MKPSLPRLCRVLPLLACVGFSLSAVACEEPRRVEVALGTQRLPALYWEPSERMAPAVLLLPMQGGGKEDWVLLGERLRREGFGALALDLREQGRSNREQLLADIRAGFTFLREQKKVDAARIGLVGADVGANAALNFAALEPLVPLAVLLSPGLNYRGVATEPALRDYGVRPLLLMAAEEDLTSARAVRRLAKAAQSDPVIKLYPGDAHGTNLFQIGLPVGEDIVTFLHGRL